VSYFDNATKLLSIETQPHVAVLTYGLTVIGAAQPRSVHGFIPEFEAELAAANGDERKDSARLKVIDVARKLGEFYVAQWHKAAMPPAGPPIFFLVAGFDEDEAYGRIYGISVPNAPEPVAYCADYFGVRWGGESELVNRRVAGG